MKCLECGYDNRDDNDFCSQCGWRLAVAAQAGATAASQVLEEAEQEDHMFSFDQGVASGPPRLTTACQITCEGGAAAVDGRALLAMYHELGGFAGPYPRLERLQAEVAVPDLIDAAASTPGWRALSEDLRWSLTLTPSFVALEAIGDGVEEDDFQRRLGELVAAVAKHLAPALEQRLGVRRIYQLAAPDVRAPQDWREHVAPEFLGPLLHEQVGPYVAASYQALTLATDDGASCHLQHGFTADLMGDGGSVYQLDFDIYRDGLRPFDPDDIGAAVDAFQRWADHLVQNLLVPQQRPVPSEVA